MVISLIKFILFLIFFLYIPSKIVFKLLKINIEDKLISVGLSITFGIVLITLFSLLIRYFGLNLTYLWPISILSLIYLIYNSLKLSCSRYLMNQVSRQKILILLVLFIGVLAQNIVLFRGGWKMSNDLIFPSLHDVMWNIALAGELFHHFPPENPAMAGILLKNNHYFYPFFLAIVRYITGIHIFDLYFRYGPILVSILFGFGLYAVSSIFTQNTFFRVLTIFLGYFSGNFAFFLPILFGRNFNWQGNIFFADQPFDQLINPYSVFGFTLMLFGIYCLSKIINSKNALSFGFSIIGGILFGTLYGFKSFGGITVILALGLSILISVLFHRKLYLLPITLISCLLFMGIFFFTTDIHSASMIWAPGWLLTQLMTSKDKLNQPKFADLENFYKYGGGLLGYLKIKTIELVIYLVGNLGTRLAGLIYLIYILLNVRSDRKKYIIIFSGIIILISLSIPLLFNLRNSTFNIIQFTPYGLVLLAVFSTLSIEKFYYLMKSRGKKLLGVVIIILFVTLSIPVNVKNVYSKIEAPKDIIADEEIKALNFLRENSNLQEIILINPEEFSQDPIYVPAISERRVYLSSPGYAIQTGIDPQSRLAEIKDFFKHGTNEFLTKNKITYIYHLKRDPSDTMAGFFTRLGMEAVFENNQVIIWGRK